MLKSIVILNKTDLIKLTVISELKLSDKLYRYNVLLNDTIDLSLWFYEPNGTNLYDIVSKRRIKTNTYHSFDYKNFTITNNVFVRDESNLCINTLNIYQEMSKVANNKPTFIIWYKDLCLDDYTKTR